MFGCTVENNKPSEMPVLVDKGPYSTYSRIIEMTIPGATGTIYYTIDGSDPTLNNSYIYSPSELKNEYGEIVIGTELYTNSIVKAIAIDNINGGPSKIIVMDITKIYDTPKATFLGTVNNGEDNLVVSLSTEDNSEIYYSLGSEYLSYNKNKSVYETNSGKTLEGILIPNNTQLRYYAKGEDKLSSNVSYKSYSVDTVPAPYIVDNGTLKDDVNYKIYSIECNSEDAVIKYTLDGSEPNMESLTYNIEKKSYYNSEDISYDGILVKNRETLKAKAFSDNRFDSSTVISTAYVPVAPSPSISDKGFLYGSEEMKVIALSVERNKTVDDILYTLDGTEPTEGSYSYNETKSEYYIQGNTRTEGITVPMGATVRAKGIKKGHFDSEDISKIISRKAKNPIFEDRGIYYNNHDYMILGIISEEDNSIIKLNNSIYTESSYKNTDGEMVDGILVKNGNEIEVTISVEGLYPSDCVKYTALCKTVPPVITDRGILKYSKGYERIINIKADTGAIIYYTTDGSEPTTESTRYYPRTYSRDDAGTEEGITVNIGHTIKAIAIKDNFAVSSSSSRYIDTPVLPELKIIDRGIRNINKNQRIYTLVSDDPEATIYYENGKVCYQGMMTNADGEEINEGIALDINNTYYFYSKRTGYIDSPKVSITVKTEKVETISAESIIDTSTLNPPKYYMLNQAPAGRVIRVESDDPDVQIRLKWYSVGSSAPDFFVRYSPDDWTLNDGSILNGVSYPVDYIVEVYAYKPGYWISDPVILKPRVIAPIITNRGAYKDNTSVDVLEISCQTKDVDYWWKTGSGFDWGVDIKEYETVDGKKYKGILSNNIIYSNMYASRTGYIDSEVVHVSR